MQTVERITTDENDKQLTMKSRYIIYTNKCARRTAIETSTCRLVERMHDNKNIQHKQRM